MILPLCQFYRYCFNYYPVIISNCPLSYNKAHRGTTNMSFLWENCGLGDWGALPIRRLVNRFPKYSNHHVEASLGKMLNPRIVPDESEFSTSFKRCTTTWHHSLVSEVMLWSLEMNNYEARHNLPFYYSITKIYTIDFFFLSNLTKNELAKP